MKNENAQIFNEKKASEQKISVSDDDDDDTLLNVIVIYFEEKMRIFFYLSLNIQSNFLH